MISALRNSRVLYAALWTLLGLASASLLFYDIGRHPFLDYDESAYGVVTRETYAHSQSPMPFTLYFAHDPWIDKPPLHFWFGNLMMQFGFIPEVALRLFSALAALGCLILTWLIAYAGTRKKSLAFLASFILLSIPAFVDTARQAKQDMAVLFFMLLPLYGLVRSKSVALDTASNVAPKHSSAWLMLIGPGIALGVMTKSVIGLLALPLLFIFSLGRFSSMKLFLQNFSWIKSGYFWLGNLIGLCIALPWHAYMLWKFGDEFIQKYVLVHIIERYSSNLFQSDAGLNVYGYYLLNYAMPWLAAFLLIGIVGIFLVIANIRRKDVSVNPDAPTSNLLIKSLAWIAFIVTLFSFSGTKAPYYLVPVYPFMALAIASGVGLMHAKVRMLKNAPLRQALALSGLIASAVLFVSSFTQAYTKGFRLDPSLNHYTMTSYEEREIAATLRDRMKYADGRNIHRTAELPEEAPHVPVLFYDSRYWETVRYYSDGLRLDQFKPAADRTFADTEQYRRPYYLIVGSKDFEAYKRVQDRPGTVIYSGTYFQLIYVI